MVMTPKEKKAFVARMKKGKKNAAKGKKKRGGGKKKKGLSYATTERLEDRIENLEAIIKSAQTTTFGQIPLSKDKEIAEREQLLEIVRDPENYTKADLKRMYKAGRIN